jgi:hypothetical protein
VTDLTELRAQVIAARDDAARSGSALSRLSADGLAMLYDRMVPPHMRVLDTERATLVVTPQKRLTSLDAAEVIRCFSTAVASVGMEIREPNAAPRALTPKDYARFSIRVATTHGGGPITLTADAADVFVEDVDFGPRSPTQAAVERLVNLLPSGPGDTSADRRMEAARAPSARAICKVAQAARRAGGIALALDSGSESVESKIDEDLAKTIVDRLAKFEDQVKPRRPVHGTWDGMRYSRREFFLDLGDKDMVGLVAEDVVPKVRGLGNGPVVATIEDVVRVHRDGRIGRPIHHLVDIRPDATLPL